MQAQRLAAVMDNPRRSLMTASASSLLRCMRALLRPIREDADLFEADGELCCG